MKKFVFLSFSFFFFWFPQQNINQSKTKKGDKKLPVELFNKNQRLIVLNLYRVSINKIQVPEFITVKVL